MEGEQLTARELFIPLRHSDLIRKLQQRYQIQRQQLEAFQQLCDRLSAIFHIEHLSSLLKIEELYDPLDPDSEMVQLEPLSESQLDDRTGRFFDRVKALLFSAHYQRLTQDQLQEAIRLGWQWGVKLDVDFDLFDQLEVFARGYRTVEATRRRWQNFYRQEKLQLPEFHRLVLAFRLKDSERLEKGMRKDVVYLKTFKNIPESDLDILLPGSKVKLTILDRGRILLPTISGAALTIYKIARGLVLLTLASIAGIWGWIVLIGALLLYISKSFFSYFRTKDKYQFHLTRNLYLKNLDNNAGVLYRIFNEAEEQELCEAILGYTVLWQGNRAGSMSELEIDQAAEQFLLGTSGRDVDFDLHDALGKLARLGLAQVDQRGHWTATDIHVAARRLSENWQQLFNQRVLADNSDGTGGSEEDLFTG